MRQDPRMRKPFIRLGIPSQKPLNTDSIRVRGKVGGDVADSGIYKQSINWKRIATESNRKHYAEARFVPIPVLVKSDGERCIPRKYRRVA